MMRKYKSGGAKKAKSGTKVKMAKSGSTLKKAPAGSKGKGMRSLPKAVRNKIGFAKKGSKTRKCKSGCK
jgi:protoporphyrinogen oxidase